MGTSASPDESKQPEPLVLVLFHMYITEYLISNAGKAMAVHGTDLTKNTNHKFFPLVLCWTGRSWKLTQRMRLLIYIYVCVYILMSIIFVPGLFKFKAD